MVDSFDCGILWVLREEISKLTSFQISLLFLLGRKTIVFEGVITLGRDMSDILLILDLSKHLCELWLSVILFAYCVSAKNTTELIYAGKDFIQALQIGCY